MNITTGIMLWYKLCSGKKSPILVNPFVMKLNRISEYKHAMCSTSSGRRTSKCGISIALSTQYWITEMGSVSSSCVERKDWQTWAGLRTALTACSTAVNLFIEMMLLTQICKFGMLWISIPGPWHIQANILTTASSAMLLEQWFGYGTQWFSIYIIISMFFFSFLMASE